MREVAHRIFADEIYRSNLRIEEGGRDFLITPTGARCNRIYVVGVLTEVEEGHARIADPTGVFMITTGKYNREIVEFFSNIKPPEFVALVGKVRMYEDTIFIRAEEVNLSSSEIRDRWVINTAERTMERIECIRKETDDPGVMHALRHYPIDEGFLDEMRNVVLEAVRTIQKRWIDVDSILLELMGGKGIEYSKLIEDAGKRGIPENMVEEGIKKLMDEGKCYEPKMGVLKRI
ncbi:MAG: hypothetical protein ACXQT5_06715 [Candidatus Syntropharchaeia archaeon]